MNGLSSAVVEAPSLVVFKAALALYPSKCYFPVFNPQTNPVFTLLHLCISPPTPLLTQYLLSS